MHDEPIFSGSRNCPQLDCITEAIACFRKYAFQFATLDFSQGFSTELVPVYNFAVIYLLWHQFFSIGTRGIRLPYVPIEEVAATSGIGSITDKDSGSGYKTRLTWMRPELLVHMNGMEMLAHALAAALQIHRPPSDAKIFFLKDAREAIEVTPSCIEQLTSEVFPFPANTPRHIMRFLLRESGATNEVIETFMGHWHVGREPWGKFSSFNFSAYLADIRVRIPKILDDVLGFSVPPFRMVVDDH